MKRSEKPSRSGVYRVFTAAGIHPTNPNHEIHVPDEAIADRMKVYGLATEAEALDAIMYEHYVRLQPDAPLAFIPRAVRDKMTAVWGPEMKGPRGVPQTSEEVEQVRARLDERRPQPKKHAPMTPGRRE